MVAADHGVAFPQRRERRRLRRDTAVEIAPVPLLIKAPEPEASGEVDDAWVETIDILPTIFDVLELDPKVKMDGRSAFSDEVQNRDELRMLIRNTLRRAAHPGRRVRARAPGRSSTATCALFGTGRDGPAFYRIGPNQELLGESRRRPGSSRSTWSSPTRRDYRKRRPGRAVRARPRGRRACAAAARAAATSRWR